MKLDSGRYSLPLFGGEGIMVRFTVSYPFEEFELLGPFKGEMVVNPKDDSAEV